MTLSDEELLMVYVAGWDTAKPDQNKRIPGLRAVATAVRTDTLEEAATAAESINGHVAARIKIAATIRSLAVTAKEEGEK